MNYGWARSRITAAAVAAGTFVLALASSARAGDPLPPASPAPNAGGSAPAAGAPLSAGGIPFPAAPAVPADSPPMAPPPPPPPPQGPRDAAPPPEVSPDTELGSAAGLYPSAAERACDIDRCLCGMPEVRVALYDPTARFQIPWTGGYNPWCEKNWTLYAAETLTYDSNVYAADHDAKSDWISNSSVGATYRREGSQYWALASAILTYSHYFTYDQEDNLSLYGNFEFGWKGACVYWSVKDQVGYSQNPIVIRDDKFVVVDQNLDPYWTNALAARVGLDRTCWKAELEWKSELFHAQDGVDTAFNNCDNGLTARYDYIVSDKTSVGAYAGYRFINYSDSTQREFDVATVGATFSWRPTAKFGVAGRIGGGWTYSSGGGSDNSAITGGIDASWDPTENLTLVLGWQRDFEASLGADDQIVDLVHLRAQTLLGGCWTLNLSTGTQLGNTQGATADGAKDYTLFFFDVMLHRSIGDHWGVDAGYQYRKQNSEDNGIDYDQSRVTVGITFSF